MAARVQSEPFDIGAALAGFGAGAGAIVTFSGLVRDEGGRLVALEIEHYPGMTERRWPRMAGLRRNALAWTTGWSSTATAGWRSASRS